MAGPAPDVAAILATRLEVLSAIERIRRFPSAWHPLSESVRRCQLKRFPYGLIYVASDPEVLIVAVACLHRRPDYWRNRRKS